jgi:hypothetical protein
MVGRPWLNQNLIQFQVAAAIQPLPLLRHLAIAAASSSQQQDPIQQASRGTAAARGRRAACGQALARAASRSQYDDGG